MRLHTLGNLMDVLFNAFIKISLDFSNYDPNHRPKSPGMNPRNPMISHTESWRFCRGGKLRQVPTAVRQHGRRKPTPCCLRPESREGGRFHWWREVPLCISLINAFIWGNSTHDPTLSHTCRPGHKLVIPKRSPAELPGWNCVFSHKGHDHLHLCASNEIGKCFFCILV